MSASLSKTLKVSDATPAAAAEAEVSTKVCLITYCRPVDVDSRVEDIYIFDLSKSESKGLLPALRLDPKSPIAHLVLDSKLYVFEAFLLDSEFDDATAVYTCDLSALSSPVYDPDSGESPPVVPMWNVKERMERFPLSMKGVKRCPCAILVPNSRNILVFSSLIDLDRPYYDPDNTHHYVDFELLDSVNNRWVELPSLPPYSDTQATIVSYYFIDKNTFVVHLSSLPFTFSLKLDRCDPKWEILSDVRYPRNLGEIVEVGDKGITFNPRALYNIQRGFIYPNSRFHNADVDSMKIDWWDISPITKLATVVSNHASQICVVNSVHHHDGGNPHVYIDIYEVNLDEDASNIEASLLTKIGGYRFVLGIKYFSYRPMALAAYSTSSE